MNEVKPRFKQLICGALLLLSLLLLVDCRRAAVQEVSPPPAPTLAATLPAATNATPARDPLDGTSWVLVSLQGEPPLKGTRITLEFSSGFLRGFAGCNTYDRAVIGDDVAGAMYKAGKDGSLTVPRLAQTLLACPAPEGANEQEQAYRKALTSATAFRLVENRLELQDAGGETILVFSR